jgi:hypothetical protein
VNLSGWKRFSRNASFAIGAFAACWVVAAGFLALLGGRPAVRELGVDGAIVVFGLAIAIRSRIEAHRVEPLAVDVQPQQAERSSLVTLLGWRRFLAAVCSAVGALAVCWAVAAGFLALVGGRPAVRELGVEGTLVVFGLAIAIRSRIEARRAQAGHPCRVGSEA